MTGAAIVCLLEGNCYCLCAKCTKSRAESDHTCGHWNGCHYECKPIPIPK